MPLPGVPLTTRDADFGDMLGYRYRWLLTRKWHSDLKQVLWIMLNPSTADATVDDPTIKKVIRFTQRMGGGAIEVVNLFGLQATDPRDLITHPEPVGYANNAYIAAHLGLADEVVCAWGNLPKNTPELLTQVQLVNGLLVMYKSNHARRKNPIWALGFNQNGFPTHPLYIPLSQKMKEFDPAVFKQALDCYHDQH